MDEVIQCENEDIEPGVPNDTPVEEVKKIKRTPKPRTEKQMEALRKCQEARKQHIEKTKGLKQEEREKMKPVKRKEIEPMISMLEQRINKLEALTIPVKEINEPQGGLEQTIKRPQRPQKKQEIPEPEPEPEISQLTEYQIRKNNYEKLLFGYK